MPEPKLDADDIQGNIIPGFRRKHQLLLGYRAGSEGVLRSVLSALAPRVTPVPPVMRHRDGRKAALEANNDEPEIPDLWVNLALGAAALDRLDESAVRQLDPAFNTGMRPSRTGDSWSPTDANGGANPWHPSNWKVGNPQVPLDLLVMLAFDDWAQAGGDALVAEIDAIGIQEIYREQGIRLPNDAEHFGFADGIAEIGVRGDVEFDGQVRPITTRYGVPPRDGVEYGRPGQPLAWPGQFLVGAATGGTSTDPAPVRYRNGSFLVFRRLSQDVRAFDEDTVDMARALGMPEAHLRAAIIGRWPSGAALMRHHVEPPGADDALAANYFAFGTAAPDLQLASGAVTGAAADPAPIRGLICPAFAHVRKVNPRDLSTDLGDEVKTRSFQMLRRGIPFGPLFDRTDPGNPANEEPRGLLFLAYQRSPSRQFERLNTAWMNTPKGPGPGGFDLLVGQRVSAQTGFYEAKDATLYDAAEPTPGRDLVANRTWVKPSGGAYLFAPSLSHIRAMAVAPATNANLFKAKMVLTLDATDFAGAEAVRLERQMPRHDGDTQSRTKGDQTYLLAADWPETALLKSSAALLGGAGIASLDLSGKHFPTEKLSQEEAEVIAQQSELRSLRLDGVTLDGATLAALVRTLPHLRELNLAGCDLDDADIATLLETRSDFIQLVLGLAPARQGHRFAAPRLTAAVVKVVEVAGRLRRLSLLAIPIDDTHIVQSDLWDQIEQLDLSETRVSDAGARRLAHSPRLSDLSLASTQVGDVGAEALVLRRLEALDISWTNVSQASLLRAQYPDAFRRLRVAGLALGEDFAQFLTHAIDLEEIDLSKTGVAGGAAAALGALPKLKRVMADQTALRPGDFEPLLRAPIEILDIRGVRTDEASRQALARSESLSQLSLSVDGDWQGLDAITAQLSLEATESAAGAPPSGLTTLWLRGELTAPFAVRLAELEMFKSLSVDAVADDVRFNRGFAHLEDFRAEGAGLNDEAFAAIAEHPSIGALYVSNNPIGAALRHSLSPAIHTLELRYTNVDDTGIEVIAQLPRLHCIDVPGTKVTASGVARLAHGAVNLQSLALDARQVQSESVEALAQCARLLELYLYGPEVTTATIAALAPVPLRELLLVGTQVGDDAVPHLAAIRGLRTLSLGTELSDAGLAALRALRPYIVIRSERETSRSTRKR